MKVSRFHFLLGMMLLAAFASAQAENNCAAFTINQDDSQHGQDFTCLGGPVLGFVFSDASGQIHPILGISGSMRLGGPLDLGFRLDAAAIPETQRYALTISSEDHRVVTLGFRGRTIDIRETALPRDPGKISLSATGAYAVLFYPSLRQLYVVSQLPNAVQAWIADASVIQDGLTALAVSDDGALVLAGTTGGAVYSFGSNGEVKLAASMTSPTLGGFLRNSHDAVIADGTEKKLFYYSEAAGNSWNFGPELDNSLTPLDIAFSNNNDRVFLVNTDSENIVSISLETGQAGSFACNCVPRRLSAVHGDSLFRITDVGDSAVLLFQPNSSGGEILFVPVADPLPPVTAEEAPSDQ